MTVGTEQVQSGPRALRGEAGGRRARHLQPLRGNVGGRRARRCAGRGAESGRLLTWTLAGAGINALLQAAFAALTNEANELEPIAER